MSWWRRSPLDLVLGTVLILGFGMLLGVLLSESITHRMEGMTMTGGTGSMPGMAMPSQAPDASRSRTTELAAAHADVEASRFAQALPVYERALRDNPHNTDALIHQGMSLAGVGRVGEGLDALDRALAMDPDNLHALWSKAQILFDVKRDYAASIPVWERIASLAPNSPDAATARGYVLRAQERLRGQPEPGRRRGSS